MKTRYLGLLVGVWYLLAPFVWGYTACSHLSFTTI
jgi:hypothetical protein